MAGRSFIYNSASPRGFRLSRYQIESYLSCARCFYLRIRFGIKPLDFHPYTLNSAVDVLLKKEFDEYRRTQEPHPLMKQYGIDGYPYDHPLLGVWRDTFRGMQYVHESTGYVIVGAPDDLWYVPDRGVSIVDYKSTSSGRDHSIGSDYWAAFKRQIEIYHWILHRIINGEIVSNIGYFVLANGRRNEPRFDARLHFDMEILSFEINDEWVEQAIEDIFFSLQNDILPNVNATCKLCTYREHSRRKEFPT